MHTYFDMLTNIKAHVKHLII